MIHLFKSHYSLRSILTIDKAADKITNDKPVSLATIEKVHKLPSVTLVEDRLAGYIEALKNLKRFQFGWRATCCESIDDLSEESEKTEHRVVIFARNTQGWYDLLRIHNAATAKGRPRVDLKLLKGAWTKNLRLAIPFFDSFLHKNALSFSSCYVDLAGLEPTFLREEKGLPYEGLLDKLVVDYAAKNGFATEMASSVYYMKRSDFPAYLTYRCITEQRHGKRRTLSAPGFEYMCSDRFAFLDKDST